MIKNQIIKIIEKYCDKNMYHSFVSSTAHFQFDLRMSAKAMTLILKDINDKFQLVKPISIDIVPNLDIVQDLINVVEANLVDTGSVVLGASLSIDLDDVPELQERVGNLPVLKTLFYINGWDLSDLIVQLALELKKKQEDGDMSKSVVDELRALLAEMKTVYESSMNRN